MSETKVRRVSKRLTKKIEIDYNNCKWYSKSTSILKTPEKRKRVKKVNNDTEIVILPEPSPKKRRTNTKIFNKPKYLSPSAKMDSKIPKVEDLLRDREKSEKIKEIDKLIKKSSTEFLKQLNTKDVQVKEKPKLPDMNCKHLTLEQLNSRFRKDIKYLDGVFNGRIYSERHELFQKQLNCVEEFTQADLRFSESLGTFTNDQLVHLVTLFRERYDNGNKYKNSDYYFKVLLPEYCLKIFMDIYKMQYQNALEYLKHIPVPNLYGLV